MKVEMVERGEILLVGVRKESKALGETIKQAVLHLAADRTVCVETQYPQLTRQVSAQALCMSSRHWSLDPVSALYSKTRRFRLVVVPSTVVQDLGAREHWQNQADILLIHVNYRRKVNRVVSVFQTAETLFDYLLSVKILQIPNLTPVDLRKNAFFSEFCALFQKELEVCTSFLPRPFPNPCISPLTRLTTFINSNSQANPLPVTAKTLEIVYATLNTQRKEVRNRLLTVKNDVKSVQMEVKDVKNTVNQSIQSIKWVVKGLNEGILCGSAYLSREIAHKNSSKTPLFTLKPVKMTKNAVFFIEIIPKKEYLIPAKVLISAENVPNRVINFSTKVKKQVKVGHLSEFPGHKYEIKVTDQSNRCLSNVLTVVIEENPRVSASFLKGNIGNLRNLEQEISLSGGLEALDRFRELGRRWRNPEIRQVDALQKEVLRDPVQAQTRLEELGFRFE